MAESPRCSACQSETAASCDRNFDIARAALASGAESTLDGRWHRVIINEDGTVNLSPAGLHDALAAQSLLGAGFMRGLMESQKRLGCNLNVEEIDSKLMIEQA